MHYDEDAQQFSLAAEEEATVTEAAKEVKMMVANFMLNVYQTEETMHKIFLTKIVSTLHIVLNTRLI